MTLSDRMLRMQNLLQKSLQPTFLDIIDDSEKHKNHAGAAGGMGHYTIKIVSIKCITRITSSFLTRASFSTSITETKFS